jgi:aryl-alcohol dehydrogenase-like predicted oxidoreductase
MTDGAEYEEVPLRIGNLTLNSPLGIGTNKWGVSSKYNAENIASAYNTSLKLNCGFFNTAQFYNDGESEQCLGRLRTAAGKKGLIVSKFNALGAPANKLVRQLLGKITSLFAGAPRALLTRHA